MQVERAKDTTERRDEPDARAGKSDPRRRRGPENGGFWRVCEGVIDGWMDGLYAAECVAGWFIGLLCSTACPHFRKSRSQLRLFVQLRGAAIIR